jgi:hypothetical protein
VYAVLLSLVLITGDGDQARSLAFGTHTLEQAKKLDGAIVEIVCEVGLTVMPDEGTTTIGVTEEDGLSRTVVFRGEHHEFEVGQKLRTWGRLRVIRHAEVEVYGAKVPGWTEIRVEPIGTHLPLKRVQICFTLVGDKWPPGPEESVCTAPNWASES